MSKLTSKDLRIFQAPEAVTLDNSGVPVKLAIRRTDSAKPDTFTVCTFADIAIGIPYNRHLLLPVEKMAMVAWEFSLITTEYYLDVVTTLRYKEDGKDRNKIVRLYVGREGGSRKDISTARLMTAECKALVGNHYIFALVYLSRGGWNEPQTYKAIEKLLAVEMSEEQHKTAEVRMPKGINPRIDLWGDAESERYQRFDVQH